MPPVDVTRNGLWPALQAELIGFFRLASISPRIPRFGKSSRGLMHRRGLDLLLHGLEVIEALEGAIELVAFLLSQLGFHLRDDVGQPDTIELFQRASDIR